MTLVQVFDAAFPPRGPYPGCAGVALYIGGNTPHTATAAEWNAASDNGRLAQLPIWTGYGQSNPGMHAVNAAAVAKSLGWEPHHEPAWRAIALDMEGEIAEPWVLAFGRQLQAEGFLCWPYMDWSALAGGGDPPGYSVWLPTWNGVPAVPPVPNVIGAQYAPNVAFEGTHVDLSVFDAGVLASFGVGPRT